MKKILICTKHKALAVAVSKWLKNRDDCKVYRLVGNASRVRDKLREKIEKFNPDFLITSYTNSADAHVAIINEARAANSGILAYVFYGHPEVLENSRDNSRNSPRDYIVSPDLYEILSRIVVTKAA